MDYTEIDKTYDYYERRYNLTKMASECGISSKNFNSLNSKEKFLTLSNKLKESNKINLASFFFGKLFEVSGSMDALLNKIECLIELGELEEATRYNRLGWELFLEDPEINPYEIEKKLSLQKARISFYLEKFHSTEIICEESIIKFKTREFYYLLCAVFITLGNIDSAKKFFKKYSNKISTPIEFFLEVFILLLDINLLEPALEFANAVFSVNEKHKKNIINLINRFYAFNKNKSVLKKYFEKEIKSIHK